MRALVAVVALALATTLAGCTSGFAEDSPAGSSRRPPGSQVALDGFPDLSDPPVNQSRLLRTPITSAEEWGLIRLNATPAGAATGFIYTGPIAQGFSQFDVAVQPLWPTDDSQIESLIALFFDLRGPEADLVGFWMSTQFQFVRGHETGAAAEPGFHSRTHGSAVDLLVAPEGDLGVVFMARSALNMSFHVALKFLGDVNEGQLMQNLTTEYQAGRVHRIAPLHSGLYSFDVSFLTYVRQGGPCDGETPSISWKGEASLKETAIAPDCGSVIEYELASPSAPWGFTYFGSYFGEATVEGLLGRGSQTVPVNEIVTETAVTPVDDPGPPRARGHYLAGSGPGTITMAEHSPLTASSRGASLHFGTAAPLGSWFGKPLMECTSVGEPAPTPIDEPAGGFCTAPPVRPTFA